MQVRGWNIGVCSWSLKPSSMTDLVSKVRQLGLSHVQIALNELVLGDDAACAADWRVLRDSGLQITATSIGFPGEDYSAIPMIRRTGGLVPDEQWPTRRELAIRAGKLTAALGVQYLEFHVGFVPSSSDPFYETLVNRTREVAHELARENVDLLMETGQESASELLQFHNDLNCRNLAINLDPGNMILYGAGDPLEAVAILGRHIRHVHMKDAIASMQPRLQWGREVTLGSGQVPVEAMLDALEENEYQGVISIERNSTDPISDVQTAIEVLQRGDTVTSEPEAA
jgi:sugar phosphate isomerase/epimerase